MASSPTNTINISPSSSPSIQFLSYSSSDLSTSPTQGGLVIDYEDFMHEEDGLAPKRKNSRQLAAKERMKKGDGVFFFSLSHSHSHSHSHFLSLSLSFSLFILSSFQAYRFFRVEFKCGRSCIHHIEKDKWPSLKVGDYVIVEADRGKDLGRITSIYIFSFSFSFFLFFFFFFSFFFFSSFFWHTSS